MQLSSDQNKQRKKEAIVRQFGLILAVLLSTVLYYSAAVFAQSSGSFSASYNAIQCSITDKDGTLTGGASGSGSLPDVTVKCSDCLQIVESTLPAFTNRRMAVVLRAVLSSMGFACGVSTSC